MGTVNKRSAQVTPDHLRVIVCEDDGEWVAQAIEVDYLACGESEQDAIERFVVGFTATVERNVKSNSLAHLAKPTPMECWTDLLSGHRGEKWDVQVLPLNLPPIASRFFYRCAAFYTKTK